MSAPVEFDFFRIERERPTRPAPTRRRHRVNDLVSKLNPEVLKSVIASAAVDQNSSSTESLNLTAITASETSKATMTIFYNGTVTVFDVTPHQAEKILQLARKGFSKDHVELELRSENLQESIAKDIPIARKKSLQYFLEKGKERVTAGSSPYLCPLCNGYQNSPGYKLML